MPRQALIWIFGIVFVSCFPLQGYAQEAAASVVEDHREASFLPPPIPLINNNFNKKQEDETKDVTVAPPSKPQESAPATEEKKPAAPAKEQPENKKIESKDHVGSQIAPTSPVSAVATPSKEDGDGVLAVPAVQSSAAAAQQDFNAGPVVLGVPVVQKPLGDIDPETMGLLSPSNGGLGASLWQGTARALVDRLMPTMALPTLSPSLNNLARRLFLTTAAAPYLRTQDDKPRQSLLAARVEALMALGAVTDAWKLASLAEARLVDPETLRLLTEAALIGPDSKEICDRIPSMMAAHGKTQETAVEWQKSLLVCQMRAGDEKSLLLGLDMMREQSSSDAVFLALMNKNLLGHSKQLPRQLTPLRPLNLAVLRQIDLPLPSTLYARAEASMIPELLLTKAQDENARLSLAEKAAARGIITSAQLAQAYQSYKMTPEAIASANTVTKATPISRAMAYQAALNEKQPQKRQALAQKLVEDVSPEALTGGQGALAASLLEDIPVNTDLNAFSVSIARFFVLAGQPDKALPWLKQAQQLAPQADFLEKQLTENWPLFVLSGLVADGDYAKGFEIWARQRLTIRVAPEIKDRSAAQKEAMARTGKIMLLLKAAGYAVSEEAWLNVAENEGQQRQVTPSPVLMDRLDQVVASGRAGETIMMALLLTGAKDEDASFEAMIKIVRALRQIGLAAEAQAFSREILMRLED